MPAVIATTTSMTDRATEIPTAQRLYRLVRAVNRAYAFAVLWCYIGAFVLAFCLMFVFPPGTLLLVFLGVFGLVATVGVAHLLGGVEHALARHLLRRDRCPRCADLATMECGGAFGQSGTTDGARTDARSAARVATAPTTCSSCGASFEAWGGEIEMDHALVFASPGGEFAGPGGLPLGLGRLSGDGRAGGRSAPSALGRSALGREPSSTFGPRPTGRGRNGRRPE